FQGALLAQGGDPQRGVDLMLNAMAAAEDSSERNRRTIYLSHIATAHARLNQPDHGLALLDEALQAAEETYERFFQVEIRRSRGLVLLNLGTKTGAEAELREAVVIAQQQKARWWELRAAISLAEYLLEDGRAAEGHAILKPVFDWFTEGFDTPD